MIKKDIDINSGICNSVRTGAQLNKISVTGIGSGLQ